MNEKVKSLIDHSSREWDEETDEYPDMHVDLEKFAELIVQETTQLLQQEWYSLNNAPKFEDGESPRDVGIRVGRKSEIISLIAKINKHFGVK